MLVMNKFTPVIYIKWGLKMTSYATFIIIVFPSSKIKIKNLVLTYWMRKYFCFVQQPEKKEWN